ncbi:MAG: VWA domain-containing protein, partial [Pseudomonadota bacterium]
MYKILLVFIVVGLFAVFWNASHSPSPQGDYAAPQTDDAPDRGAWPFLEDTGNPPISDDLLRINVYVVLDGSGSMEASGCSGGRQKIDAAKQALLDFGKSAP